MFGRGRRVNFRLNLHGLLPPNDLGKRQLLLKKLPRKSLLQMFGRCFGFLIFGPQHHSLNDKHRPSSWRTDSLQYEHALGGVHLSDEAETSRLKQRFFDIFLQFPNCCNHKKWEKLKPHQQYPIFFEASYSFQVASSGEWL